MDRKQLKKLVSCISNLSQEQRRQALATLSEGTVSSASPAPTYNYNIVNSRVNINSIDNSINESADFSSEQLRDFIKEVRLVLSQLPQDSQKIVEAQLGIIEEEADEPKPSKMRVLSALQFIKSVVEGASGNLVATGIRCLIDALVNPNSG